MRLKFDRFKGFVEEYSANLSLGGMFIRTDEPAPVGTVLPVEFRLGEDYELITGRGRVVWIRTPEQAVPEHPPGMGIRFLELTPGSRELIFKMVERRVREGGDPFDLDEAADLLPDRPPEPGPGPAPRFTPAEPGEGDTSDSPFASLLHASPPAELEPLPLPPGTPGGEGSAAGDTEAGAEATEARPAPGEIAGAESAAAQGPAPQAGAPEDRALEEMAPADRTSADAAPGDGPEGAAPPRPASGEPPEAVAGSGGRRRRRGDDGDDSTQGRLPLDEPAPLPGIEDLENLELPPVLEGAARDDASHRAPSSAPAGEDGEHGAQAAGAGAVSAAAAAAGPGERPAAPPLPPGADGDEVPLVPDADAATGPGTVPAPPDEGLPPWEDGGDLPGSGPGSATFEAAASQDTGDAFGEDVERTEAGGPTAAGEPLEDEDGSRDAAAGVAAGAGDGDGEPLLGGSGRPPLGAGDPVQEPVTGFRPEAFGRADAEDDDADLGEDTRVDPLEQTGATYAGASVSPSSSGRGRWLLVAALLLAVAAAGWWWFGMPPFGAGPAGVLQAEGGGEPQAAGSPDGGTVPGGADAAADAAAETAAPDAAGEGSGGPGADPGQDASAGEASPGAAGGEDSPAAGDAAADLAGRPVPPPTAAQRRAARERAAPPPEDVRAIRLEDVRHVAEDGATLILVRTDSPLRPEDVIDFRIDGDNPRHVVQIRGIEEPYGSGRVPVGTAQVERVRSGLHRNGDASEIHLVLDLASPAARVREVQALGDRLRIEVAGGGGGAP